MQHPQLCPLLLSDPAVAGKAVGTVVFPMRNHPCAQCSPTGELTAFPMGPQGLPARQTNPPGSGWLQCTASFPGLYPAQLEPPHGTASTQTEPVQRRDTCCQCHQRQTTQRAWGQHSWETEMCSTSSSTATTLASSVPTLHPKTHPRTPGGTGCSAVPCPCSRCPGPGCVSMMGHIPLPHTCSCSAFQVTGPAAPDFSRLSHFWHLPSQSETQCFPLSPSIWNPGLEEFSH